MDKSKIIMQVKKLLALSSGTDFKAESETALLKVHKILKEYNLTMHDIDTSTSVDSADFIGVIVHEHDYIVLLKRIALLYFSETVYIEGKGCIIIGEEVNILSTKIMYEYLIERIEHETNKKTVKSKILFKQGMIIALLQKIMQLSYRVYGECKALVCLNKEKINNFLSKFQDSGTMKPDGKLDTSSTDFMHGFNKGRNTNLSLQIKEGETVKKLS